MADAELSALLEQRAQLKIAETVGRKNGRAAAWYEERPAEQRFVGLLNQGATCYLNSLVQALFVNEPVRRVRLRRLEPRVYRVLTSLTGDRRSGPSRDRPCTPSSTPARRCTARPRCACRGSSLRSSRGCSSRARRRRRRVRSPPRSADRAPSRSGSTTCRSSFNFSNNFLPRSIEIF